MANARDEPFAPYVVQHRAATARRSLAAIARAANVAVAGIVIAAAAGWMVDSDLLRTFGADFPALQLSSAIAFLIAAAALDAAQRDGARGVRRARAGAAAVAVIAALMLAGHALGIRAGLDLAFLGLARGGTHVPLLMPVASALVLELVAAAIVVATCRAPWTEVVNRVAAAALLGIALLAIVGLSFRLLLEYGVAPLFGMALPDAIAFFLLGASLLAGRPDAWLVDLLSAERPGAVMSRWLLPAAIVVPILAHLAQLFAQRVGLVDEPLGQGLLVLLTVAGLGALTLWIGHALDRLNARRVRAEHALRASYDELDARVVERTAALERATAALSERNRLFAAVTASTAELIFAKDIAGRLLMVNAAYLAAIGRAEVDVIGRTSLELATDVEAGRAKAEHDRVVVESGRSLTVEEVFPGSAARTYLTTKSPLRDEQGGIVIGIIGGYLTGVLLLGADSGAYLYRLQSSVTTADVNGGFIKALVFGVLVSVICCFQGYFCHMRSESSGAKSVGLATRSAVVMSCTMILVSDYVVTSLLM